MPNVFRVSGGEKADEAIRDIARQLKGGGVVRVGFLSNAKYPDGTPVAAVAAWQNFGTRRIPARPFFSNMVRDKASSWSGAITQNLRATNYNTQLTLERVGAGIKGQLQQSIVATVSPPLSPKTIKRKGSAKPLVDSGHMLNSADYAVTTKT